MQIAIYSMVLLGIYLYHVATDLLLQVCEVQNQGNDRDSHKGGSSVKVKLAIIFVCRQMSDIVGHSTCISFLGFGLPV